MAMPLELETERLILRQFRESVLDAFAEICANPEVMRYIGEFKPLDRMGTWRIIAFQLGHWQLRGYGMWAVEEKATRRLIDQISGMSAGMAARSRLARGCEDGDVGAPI